MTKYVLNSGGLRNNPKKGKEFLAELVKGLGKKPKMLIVLFAQPRENWEAKFITYEDEENDWVPKGVKVYFELAMPDTFEEQIKRNDIVYIAGGDDHLLKYWLKKFDLPRIWEDKVVAGSSAGSDALVDSYWACDWREIQDGLGIVPIKFIPHYESDFGSDDLIRGPIDWTKAKPELESHGDNSLPIHALPEGHFIVIEQ